MSTLNMCSYSIGGPETDYAARYVHSMESQQRRLIKALQKVHLDVRKSIKEEDMNEIVQIVRACGFDFESVSAMPAAHSENEDPENKLRKGGYESSVPATTLERALGKKDTGDGHRPPTIIRADSECPRKRTREEFGDEIEPATAESSVDTDKDVIRNAVSIPNERCDDGTRPQTSPLKRQKMSTCTGLMDNLGNLKSYEDQTNLLNTPSDPKNTFAPPHSGQSAEASPQNTWQPMAQWPSNLSTWGPDYSPTPTTFNSSDPHNLADSSRKTDSTAEVTEFSSSVSPVGLDWESTLWWDPSLAFDMANESLGLGVEDLVSQPFEPAYELKGSNT